MDQQIVPIEQSLNEAYILTSTEHGSQGLLERQTQTSKLFKSNSLSKIDSIGINEPQPFCFLTKSNIDSESDETKAQFLTNVMPISVEIHGKNGNHHFICPPKFRIRASYLDNEMEFITQNESESKQAIGPYASLLSKTASEKLDELNNINFTEKSLEELGYSTNDIKNWDDIQQPEKSDLYKILRHMIENHINTNIKIKIDDIICNCHMMVLQCYSNYFINISNENLVVLPSDKISVKSFVMAYAWMLAENPIVQRDGLLELFSAAHFLKIPNLINQCWLCIDDDQRFREDSAFLLYMEARQHKLPILEQLMLTRICKFFLTLVSSKDFLELNVDEVCTLLKSNTVGVNCETEIFMSAVRWINYDWANREKHMVDVTRCVRFSLLPPWFLISLAKTTDSNEINNLVQHPDVARLISDGISYNTAQLFYGNHRQDYLAFLERYDLKTPAHRQWIYDMNCNYHTNLECPNMGYVTYKDFSEYLEFLQEQCSSYWESIELLKSDEDSVFANTHILYEADELNATSRTDCQ